jgi:glycosidase
MLFVPLPSRALLSLITLTSCAAHPALDAGIDAGVDSTAMDARSPSDARAATDAQGIDRAQPATDAQATDAQTPDAAITDAATPVATDWTAQVLYLALPDRFTNGDPSNDSLGAADCFAPTDPRRFHGGDLAGTGARLDYLRALGASALWITPVYQQIARRPSGACGYHGYWPDFADPDDGAIDPRFGTESDLRALIDAAHARSMRFVMDMVVNHTGSSARLVSQRPAWFHDPATCAALGPAEVFCPIGSSLPDLAQERGDVADYLSAQSARWASRFAIDAVRMDTAKHVPAVFFRDRWAPAVRAARPDVHLIAEVFSEGSARDLQPMLAAGFDSAFDFALRRALRDTFALGGSVDAVASRVLDTIAVLGPARARLLTTMLDNHDVPRFASDTLASAANNGAVAAARYRLAMVALMTLPGVPQLYYGNEIALLGGADPRQPTRHARVGLRRRRPRPRRARRDRDAARAQRNLVAHQRARAAAHEQQRPRPRRVRRALAAKQRPQRARVLAQRRRRARRRPHQQRRRRSGAHQRPASRKRSDFCGRSRCLLRRTRARSARHRGRTGLAHDHQRRAPSAPAPALRRRVRAAVMSEERECV